MGEGGELGGKKVLETNQHQRGGRDNMNGSIYVELKIAENVQKFNIFRLHE